MLCHFSSFKSFGEFHVGSSGWRSEDRIDFCAFSFYYRFYGFQSVLSHLIAMNLAAVIFRNGFGPQPGHGRVTSAVNWNARCEMGDRD